MIYGAQKRVQYTLRGRFRTPTKAVGTVDAKTFWTWVDGTHTSCQTGQLPWSACAWKGDARKRRAGTEPEEVDETGGPRPPTPPPDDLPC